MNQKIEFLELKLDFFQNKNISIRSVSLWITASVLVFNMISLLVYYSFDLSRFRQWQYILIWIIFSIVLYLLVFNLIDRFLYRKIKVLYKIITRDRKKNAAKQVINSTDLIGYIQQDVEEFENAQLVELERLQESEKYRREFLGNVSHELKTPIFNAQGYIETLLDGDLNDQQHVKKYLAKAAENIDRLQLIVDDLLQITKYESGELTFDFENIDIHACVKEVFHTMDLRADTKQVRCGFREGCDTAILAYADRNKIIDVLINLIGNAINYGNSGGIVNVGLYKMEDHVLVEITDNGPGIEEQHLRRLFERFYRVDKHRNRSVGGTGLGLSIVKHIIEAHGQRVGVRSSVGKGSTFWFTLALKKE